MRYRPSSHPFLHKKIVGNYEYNENDVIGRGSHSLAFEGKRIGREGKVCIKQITVKSSLVDKSAKNEISVLKKVNHRNLVQYIDSFDRGISTYVVT